MSSSGCSAVTRCRCAYTVFIPRAFFRDVVVYFAGSMALGRPIDTHKNLFRRFIAVGEGYAMLEGPDIIDPDAVSSAVLFEEVDN